MMMNKKTIFFFVLALASLQGYSQKARKLSFIGGARSSVFSNALSVSDTLADTTTAKNNYGGYTLLDLGFNIQPNKQTEIMGMFRIKNNYGGFWGSGVQFDVRQLWVKGVVGNALRYQIGDLNLRQSQFTLYNHHADQLDSMPSVFKLQQNIVSYEQFYQNNTWRMQGANVDFGLSFSKFLKEINFNGFVTRLNATNFANVNERLMTGGNISILQSNQFRFGYTYNSTFDLKATTANNNLFSNTIHTFDWSINHAIAQNTLKLAGEAGISNWNYTADTLAPVLNDYFVNAYAKLYLAYFNTHISVGYLNVGPDFRSIGAQSKDVNYNSPTLFFNRFTNNQQLRPITLIDMIGNENIYNRTISTSLASENEVFNDILPYGLATFNRVGAYGKLQFQSKNKIHVQAEVYRLNEIRGQGSDALKAFSQVKLNSKIPFHTLIGLANKFEVQLGLRLQQTTRNSIYANENIDYKNLQVSLGMNYEIIPDLELLAGFVQQQNNGNSFITERNEYSEVTYFRNSNYNLTQQIAAVGLRINFSPKAYLCALLQQSSYQDQSSINNKAMADFKINQFGLIYNILL